MPYAIASSRVPAKSISNALQESRRADSYVITQIRSDVTNTNKRSSARFKDNLIVHLSLAIIIEAQAQNTADLKKKYAS